MKLIYIIIMQLILVIPEISSAEKLISLPHTGNSSEQALSNFTALVQQKPKRKAKAKKNRKTQGGSNSLVSRPANLSRRNKAIGDRKRLSVAVPRENSDLWVAKLGWLVERLQLFVSQGNFHVVDFLMQRKQLEEMYLHLKSYSRKLEVPPDAMKLLEFVENILTVMTDADIELSNASKQEFSRVYPMVFQILELKIRAMSLQKLSEKQGLNVLDFEIEIVSLGLRFYHMRQSFNDHMDELDKLINGLIETLSEKQKKQT